MGAATFEVEEIKIISKEHEVWREWKRQGKINTKRMKKRTAKRNGEGNELNDPLPTHSHTPQSFPFMCWYVCSVCISQPPEGPVFVCTR